MKVFQISHLNHLFYDLELLLFALCTTDREQINQFLFAVAFKYLKIVIISLYSSPPICSRSKTSGFSLVIDFSGFLRKLSAFS